MVRLLGHCSNSTKVQTAQKNRLQNIKHKEPQQTYRLGTISYIKLLVYVCVCVCVGGLYPVLQAPNITLIFRSGSQHLVSCSVLAVNL